MKYHKTVKKYIDNNHATKIPPEDLTPERASTTPIINYVPHLAVLNSTAQKMKFSIKDFFSKYDQIRSKLRIWSYLLKKSLMKNSIFCAVQYKPDKVHVVYDVAAKYRNFSLNDHLLKGTDLLKTEQMFHQVHRREEDGDALRFLWRENPNDYINDYKMNVHLFGKNDSPCLVNFAIIQIAKDKYDTDHIVAKSIDENFYMDNFIKSGNSLETLIHTITSVTNTLSQYGFRLHKWISNNEYLLNKISESEKASTNQAKILGINWDIESDNRTLRAINKSFIPIKRGVLSVLCSIYDPLGFIAPCILEAKLIVQECWKRNLDWDDPLPCDLLSRFEKWQKELYLIKDVKVPCFYGFSELKGDTVELLEAVNYYHKALNLGC